MSGLAQSLWPDGFQDEWRFVQGPENQDIVYVDREQRVARLGDPGNPRSWYGRSRARVATGISLTRGIPMLSVAQEFGDARSDNLTFIAPALTGSPFGDDARPPHSRATPARAGAVRPRGEASAGPRARRDRAGLPPLEARPDAGGRAPSTFNRSINGSPSGRCGGSCSTAMCRWKTGNECKTAAAWWRMGRMRDGFDTPVSHAAGRTLVFTRTSDTQVFCRHPEYFIQRSAECDC